MLRPELVNQAPNTITVWSDIGCPWGTLALRTLRAAIDAHGTKTSLDHRVFPLELFNRRPTPKRITDAEVIAIAGLLPEMGWKIWTEPDWTFAGTTIPAMEAVQAAKHPDVGGLEASDELDAALRQAFWCDSKCISVNAVIKQIAATCSNVDADALEWAIGAGEGRWRISDQWPVAQTEHVRCSPHVFTPSGTTVANPGANYTWIGGAEVGFPRMDSYDATWAEALVADVAVRSDISTV